MIEAARIVSCVVFARDKTAIEPSLPACADRVNNRLQRVIHHMGRRSAKKVNACPCVSSAISSDSRQSAITNTSLQSNRQASAAVKTIGTQASVTRPLSIGFPWLDEALHTAQ